MRLWCQGASAFLCGWLTSPLIFSLVSSSSFGLSSEQASFLSEDSLIIDLQEDTTTFVFLKLTGMNRHNVSWTLVSVVMLLFMSLNLGLDIAHARQSVDGSIVRMASPPPSNKGSLGSAAITSITETLSPILPFTGGVDLRREFMESDKTWYDTATFVVCQFRDAFGMNGETTSGASSLTTARVLSIPRAGSSSQGAGTKVATASKRKHKVSSSTTNYPSPISDSKPFYPVSKIAHLTLTDLTVLFQYVMEQNQVGFDRSRFLSKVSEKVKPVIQEMDAAVGKSRGGSHVQTSAIITTTTDTATTFDSTGNVDALYFCAILRLFAEWRVLRQVPEGYKGYAVGMNLGHKDIVQNLAKMESAVHSYLDYYQKQEFPEQVTSPTLRDLLQHEIDHGVHSKLPRLKEKSAAMGLLWVRRQLHYQTCVFDNILQVPSSAFPTSDKAIAAAYSTVYGNYHGWAVQKIFNYSFNAAPDVKEIYKYMNPSLLESVKEKSKRIVVESSDESEDTDYEEEESSTLDDTTTTNNNNGNNKNPLERLIHHVGGEFDKLGRELDKFGRHVGGEWDKLVDAVVKVFDQDSEKRDMTRFRGGGANDNNSDASLQAREAFIVEKMAKDAHERISIYLKQVNPLLDDLAVLFDDLNMDDPTKV